MFLQKKKKVVSAKWYHHIIWMPTRICLINECYGFGYTLAKVMEIFITHFLFAIPRSYRNIFGNWKRTFILQDRISRLQNRNISCRNVIYSIKWKTWSNEWINIWKNRCNIINYILNTKITKCVSVEKINSAQHKAFIIYI